MLNQPRPTAAKGTAAKHALKGLAESVPRCDVSILQVSKEKQKGLYGSPGIFRSAFVSVTNSGHSSEEDDKLKFILGDSASPCVSWLQLPSSVWIFFFPRHAMARVSAGEA